MNARSPAAPPSVQRRPIAPPAPARRPARLWRRLGTLPLTCAVVTALNALSILLVVFGNLTDFDTNLPFVQHVLAMDTTNFGAGQGDDLDPAVMWRAIGSPVAQTAAYLVIIAWEAAAAGVLLVATWRWITARDGPFERARRSSAVGLLMVVLLFFGGFIAVGGEWFQMWRSTEWNGLDPAFRYAGLALFGLVLIHLPSPEWEGRG